MIRLATTFRIAKAFGGLAMLLLMPLAFGLWVWTRLPVFKIALLVMGIIYTAAAIIDIAAARYLAAQARRGMP